MNITLGLPPILPKDTPVAMDVELFHAEAKRLHRPTGEFACLSICFDPSTVYLIEDVKDVRRALQNVKKSQWIFHNAMFDIRQLRRWATVPDSDWWDTMIVERELYGGYYDAFALDDLSRRWLGEYLPKETRKSFTTATEMTPEKRKYAARDALTTFLCYEKQRKVYEEYYSEHRIWEEVDLPALQVFLEFKGMMLDVPEWKKLIAHHLREKDKIRSELDFNPGSWQQVQKVLQKHGIKVKTTGVEDLEEHNDNPIVKQILAYRYFAKAASTYGENFLKMIEEDGRIYSSFNVCGAETGRTCVSADTKISTNLGTFRICDLPLKSSSLCTTISHTGKEQRIKRLIYRGREKMYRVTNDKGNTIICTYQHKFLTPTGWKALREITHEDSIYSYTYAHLWENQSSRRSNLSEDIFRIFAIGLRGMQKVWNITYFAISFNSLLQSKISRRDTSENFNRLSNCVCKKENKTEGSTETIRQGATNCVNCSGENGVGNIQNLESGSSNCPEKYSRLSLTSSFRAFILFVRRGMVEFNRTRRNNSGDNGRSLSYSGKPNGVFSSLIRFLYISTKNHSYYKKDGKTIRLLPKSKSSTARLCYVGRQLLRVIGFRGTSQIGGFAHTTISLGDKGTQNLYGRYIHSPIKSFDRNRWINSWGVQSSKNRQTENSANEFFGLQSFAFRFKRSIGAFIFRHRFYTTSHIISIDPIGVDDVWDIEVEDDASYLSQGFINHNSSDHPNFQNIPVRSGPHFRKCFIAPRGRRYVIADSSQQEPRINAYMAQDHKAINLFKTGDDVYLAYGQEILGVKITKSDPRRKVMKPLVLGLAYGLSEYGLSRQCKQRGLDISVEEARRLIRRLRTVFPAQARYIDRMRSTSAAYVTTPVGRRFWLNRYSQQWTNNVLNAPVQGGAADGSKIAMPIIRDEIKRKGLDAFFVAFIHDEFLVECATKDAMEVAKIVRRGMVESSEATCPGVSFEADVFLGNNWADKDNEECKVHFKEKK